jgi:hypothetical protein
VRLAPVFSEVLDSNVIFIMYALSIYDEKIAHAHMVQRTIDLLSPLLVPSMFIVVVRV